MGIGELLDQIRDYYLDRFANEVNNTDKRYRFVLEPAYCKENGQYALEGELKLPCRSDLVLTENGKAVKALTIDTENMLSFEPIEFKWDNELMVSLHPFQWNFCVCDLTGGNQSPNWEALKDWFVKWFEENPVDKNSFMRCIHYMSDPEPTDIGYKIDIDFGSAPVEAFEEFLDSIGNMGFQNIKMSSGV